MQDNTINPQNQNQTTNPVVGPPPDITPSVPTEIPPVPPASPVRRRALIPTILGLVLLVVGVGAGLLLVQQQQIFKQKAAGGGQVPGGDCANPGEQVCTSCDGAGTGLACQANNKWSTCVRVDACGGISNNTPSGFAGCGDSGKSGASGNKCDNCFWNADGTTVSCKSQNSSCGCLTGCPGVGTPGCLVVYTQPTPTPAPSTGGGGGACSSDYCAGPDQCRSQGGTPGAQGPRPSGGDCTTNTVMCCGLGSSGGGGPAPTPAPKACGETCTSDSQCRNPSANGSTVRCIGGTCQNTSCVGKTIPGANCDCSSLNACGQGCSATVGLCQSGSVCRYVVGSGCANNPNPASPTNTYCVPNTLPTGWTTTNCVARDQGNSFVLNASGANPTVAEIQQACAPTPTASCTSITAYDTNWNPLTAAQLSALQPGARVRFTVAGTTTSGVFDKARFTINGNQQAEVTTKRPNSVDFYQEYVIPAGVTSFTVTSQIHHQALNQWF